jgi:hypothetical protein
MDRRKGVHGTGQVGGDALYGGRAAALAPFRDRADLAQLKRDLAVTVSAEALFTLTDLCGLGPEEAIASAAETAATLTAAAFSGVRETRPVRD